MRWKRIEADIFLPGARSLLGLEDKDVYPIRGQTMVIDNPKVREFVSIELGNISSFGQSKPAASPSPSSAPTHHGNGDVTYIIPRPAQNDSGFTTILGGKYQEGSWDTSFSAEDARGILDRCAALVPAVKDKETKILRHNVGLRAAPKGGPRVEAEWIDVLPPTKWPNGHGDAFADRKSTRLNSSHSGESRMPSSA